MTKLVRDRFFIFRSPGGTLKNLSVLPPRCLVRTDDRLLSRSPIAFAGTQYNIGSVDTDSKMAVGAVTRGLSRVVTQPILVAQLPGDLRESPIEARHILCSKEPGAAVIGQLSQVI